ncbi:hypothetical protein HZA43_05250 [Candidatus Peregrinibacteria bacterium]|nr:hypothetical protein [Candidatus Peregrinibacteria bacterium]
MRRIIKIQIANKDRVSFCRKISYIMKTSEYFFRERLPSLVLIRTTA